MIQLERLLNMKRHSINLKQFFFFLYNMERVHGKRRKMQIFIFYMAGWALFSDNKQDLCLFCVIGSEEKSLMIVLGMRKIEEKTSV